MAKRGWYTDPRIEIAIARVCREVRGETGRNPSAAAVQRFLDDDEELQPLVPKDLRTIRRIMEELPTDETGTWSVADADPDEVALVLPVLAHVAQATAGGVWSLTRREASLIHRIRRAAPSLPEAGVWRLTQCYINDAGLAGGEVLAPYYDLLLALGAWQPGEGRVAFDRLIERAQRSRHLRWVVRGIELDIMLDFYKDDVAKLEHKGKSRTQKEENDEEKRNAAGSEVGVRRRAGPRRKREA